MQGVFPADAKPRGGLPLGFIFVLYTSLFMDLSVEKPSG
jgi:hypothetical protein